MKRLFIIGTVILCLCFLTGCNDIKEFTESPVSIEKAIILTATQEGLSPDTKTVRMDDGMTLWNPAEEISVFYGSGADGGSKFVSNNTAQAQTVEFEGSISMSGNKEFWAVYPYSADNSCNGTSITTVIPSEQNGEEGNFSGNVFPAMGKAKSLSIPFYHICGGIKFSVSRSDIMSVTFKGNNGESLAGEVKVDFGPNGKPEIVEVIDGKAEVTLNAPNGGTFNAGKYYYMTLLPAALSGGFTMSFSTGIGTGTLTSSCVQTIKRSVFGVLKDVDSKVSEWENPVPEHESVDLGLSVKWASCNVGASSSEDYGDYFAWGETTPKADYSSSKYKWYNGDRLTKYNTRSSDGIVDNKTILDFEDDAASANWGAPWRMPTKDEIRELIKNCSWEWTIINGVAGFQATSQKNGYTDKSVFFPAAGNRSGTSIYDYVGSGGSYWSSSLYTDLPDHSCDLIFGSGYLRWDHFYRSYGFSVRPVLELSSSEVHEVLLDNSELTLYEGDSVVLTATILPDKAADKSVSWKSSDDSIATVDQHGTVTGKKHGMTTISAISNERESIYATCSVIVLDLEINGYRLVNLGLPSGLKWAIHNVGASAPEEYGDYFAWGETQPKSNYSWSTYKWYNESSGTVKKYCPANMSSYWGGYGSPDNNLILDPGDDAARVNWGGSWRMPTYAEWSELVYNCNWIWNSNYNGTGIAGYLVTSDNGNSIFLPAAGGRSDTSFNDVGSYGRYWSSSLIDFPGYYPLYAGDIHFDSSVYLGGNFRALGASVRPVSK